MVFTWFSQHVTLQSEGWVSDLALTSQVLVPPALLPRCRAVRPWLAAAIWGCWGQGTRVQKRWWHVLDPLLP